MTRESTPSGEKKYFEISEKFGFMSDPKKFEETLRKIKIIEDTYAEYKPSSDDDEGFRQMGALHENNIELARDLITTLEKAEGLEKEGKESICNGDIIDLKRWNSHLKQLRQVLHLTETNTEPENHVDTPEIQEVSDTSDSKEEAGEKNPQMDLELGDKKEDPRVHDIRKKPFKYESGSNKIEEFSVVLDLNTTNTKRQEIRAFILSERKRVEDAIAELKKQGKGDKSRILKSATRDLEQVESLKEKFETKTGKKIIVGDKPESKPKKTRTNIDSSLADALDNIDTSSLESGYLESEYDKLIKSFLDSSDNRNTFLSNRRRALRDLITETINKKNKEGDDSITKTIADHIASINILLKKIEGDDKIIGRDSLIEIIKKDIDRLENLDIKSLEDVEPVDTAKKDNNKKNQPKDKDSRDADPEDKKDNKDEETEGKKDKRNDGKFKKFDLLKELDAFRLGIMGTNKELRDAIVVAVDDYNRLVENNEKEEKIAEAWGVVDRLRGEWLTYKAKYLREKKFNKKEDNKDDTAPKKDTTGPEDKKDDETSDSKPEDLDTTIPFEKIFTIKSGEDYSKISGDKEFMSWMEGIYLSLKSDGGQNTIFEQKDLKDWHKMYEESLPYYKKLRELYEDIKKLKDDKKIALTEAKINQLMYRLYRGDVDTKHQIDIIYEGFKETKEKEKVIADKNRFSQFKKDLKANRRGELTRDQVKSVFEAIGDDALSENIEELERFLKNMEENYDFYSAGATKEEESNSTRNTVARFRKFKKTDKKVNPLSRFWSLISPASIFKGVSNDEVNMYAPMIEALQKQNLVDRKDGNESKKRENALRMHRLLDLINNKKDLLLEYIKSPEGFDTSTWDDFDKDSLPVFATMYKIFSQQKYRSADAKNRAEEILEKDDDDTADSETYSQEAADIIFDFDKDEDLEALEKRAAYEVAISKLNNLEAEINAFGPTKRNIDAVKKMSDTLKEVESVLAGDLDYTDDMDKLRLKKINVKLSEIIVRHINKNDYSQLYPSLKNYDVIINSTETKKEDKEKHIKELLSILKLHLKNPKLTVFQTSELNVIIETYTKKLNSLK